MVAAKIERRFNVQILGLSERFKRVLVPSAAAEWKRSEKEKKTKEERTALAARCTRVAWRDGARMQRTLARVTGDMHAERGRRLGGTRTRKSLYELKGRANVEANRWEARRESNWCRPE